MTRTRNLGAFNANEVKQLILGDDADLALMRSEYGGPTASADAVTVTSPRKADGTHANLTVMLNGDSRRTFTLLGGGAVQSEDGPIFSVTITADAAVAGTTTDAVRVTLTGRVANLYR